MYYNNYYTEADYTAMFLELGFNLPRGSKGQCSCPKHTDRRPSMSIDLSKGIFNCFSCGYHGSVAREYYLTFGKQYGKKENYSVEDLKSLFKAREKPKILNTQKQLFKATYEKYDNNTLKKWLKYRGISPTVADKAQAFYGSVNISYLDDKGKEKSYSVHDRVMFPIYDTEHKLCSIEMRFPFLGNESEDFKASVRKVLYPKCSTVNLLYEQDKLDTSKKLYVLEGLMDCLAFRSLTGIQNSTSIFGAQLTEHQKEVLNSFNEVCYVYNNDVAGINSLNVLKESFTGKKFTQLKPAGEYDDVGEMAMNGFKEIELWLKTEC